MTQTVITLDVDNNDLDEPHPSHQQIHLWLKTFISQVCCHHNIELSVAFVSQYAMQALNLDYRQKDKPTNVLSFPSQLPAELPIKFLGDIVFCHAVIVDEAVKQKKSLEAHYAHLLIHGTLHLLGYDHIESQAAEQMEQLEVKLLASLGYSDPYREDA